MQRNWIFADTFSTLFDRRFAFQPRADKRDIFALCRALMSAEGEVSGLRLAATILERFRGLDDAAKLKFFTFLNEEMELDPDALAKAARAYADDPTPDAYSRLAKTAEPPRQEMLRRLNQPAGATAELVAMRVDLLRFLKNNPTLRRSDLDFVHLLRSWFNRGFLVLRQISWDTSARMLEKIVEYEAVHAIDDWDDLRRRLHPSDRRCFVFFHPSMPEEPLIFVEVALTRDVPGSIDDLLSDDRAELKPDEARAAVFYSISNCQKGLAGISFGNLLIKQVVTELSAELPRLDKFVTLSPMPGLNRWLKDGSDDPRAASVLNGSAKPDDVRAVAAHYLLQAKRADGMPVDPVARFHLGNGAEVHAVHADADRSAKGKAQSSGAMVNYLYDLHQTERNHEAFATNRVVTASRSVKALAETPPQPKRKEPAP